MEESDPSCAVGNQKWHEGGQRSRVVSRSPSGPQRREPLDLSDQTRLYLSVSEGAETQCDWALRTILLNLTMTKWQESHANAEVTRHRTFCSTDTAAISYRRCRWQADGETESNNLWKRGRESDGWKEDKYLENKLIRRFFFLLVRALMFLSFGNFRGRKKNWRASTSW